jgi:D-glycero-beta-D-manno-heptose-7-phosphate kinase
MQKAARYKKLFDDFSGLRVMIIGDVMVDSYLWGKVERISPEAPIPIVALRRRENRLGGASNVALNVKAMGAVPVLCTVIGGDDKGDRFMELLRQEKIDTHYIIRSPSRITTTKFRIFGNNYQMLRVDEEVEVELEPSDLKALMGMISATIRSERIDCIIFQDYDKGVITPALIAEVVALARKHSIPVTVDPKRKNFMDYAGVTLFKPNLKEMKEGLKLEFDASDQSSVISAAQQLIEMLDCSYVLTTMSEHGVAISQKEKMADRNIVIPAHIRSVADVSGAGDTVISVASLCLAMKCSPYEIAYISNLAGGLVCEEVGVVPVNREKLLKEVLSLI